MITSRRMLRREFLAALAAAPVVSARSRIDRTRISFISDEAAANPADSIAFAKQYGLRWIELREVPGGGGHYMRQSDEKLKEAAKRFARQRHQGIVSELADVQDHAARHRTAASAA